MKIGLIDVDSHNFPNIALMKISQYHKNCGDNVDWYTPFEKYDIVYMSKIFQFTPDYQYPVNAKEVIKGGTGYDISVKLPEEIECCDYDYSIYDQYNFSVQFYSRGCIRCCGFCIVRQKEGFIHSVKPKNLHPQSTHIEILDNNFFANPDWHYSVEHILSTKQKVNLHGVDVRIMQEEHAKALNKMKHTGQIHIAWDNPKVNINEQIKEVIKWIKPYKLMCYVLIGYDSTPEEDYYRVEKLREIKVDPFVMPYNKNNDYQKKFSRWVNHKAIFKTVKWEDYK